MGWAHRAWGRHAWERHEAGLVEEGHSLVAAGRAEVGRVEEGNAGPAELDHRAVVAAATGEDTRHAGQGVHRMEQVVEVKECRSIPVAVEEAGRSPAGEDSDPAGEGHHGEHPEEHRIVVEGTEAVDSLVGILVDSPGEVRLGEVRPEDNRKALVVLQKRALVY